MTNNVKFQSMNFPARVETYDNGNLTGTEIVLAEDAEKFVAYATTTREIRIIDLPSDDPAVVAEIEKRKPVRGEAEPEPNDEV
ncbi:MAG TPA: hypothetical protein VGN16_09695 [Acidobacteriaceae bacterium]|jgi:hypothetical protein